MNGRFLINRGDAKIMCDDATIKQLEAVLAWAFDEELPRGALADRIESAGGITRILNGEKKAA